MFGPALIEARDQLQWGHTKMQTVEAHWKATRDKEEVLKVLKELGASLDQPSPTNTAGWSGVEESIALCAGRFDTEKEFRAAKRPLFQRIVLDPNSKPHAKSMARAYLTKHATLDKEEEAVDQIRN